MSRKDRPLPSPPGRRFGPGESRPGAGPGELMEERLAQAAALGKLDEFMDVEFKDNEHARRLASMMMGMTGVVPSAGTPGAKKHSSGSAEDTNGVPPEDVVQAAREGNIGALMGILAREHEKRSGSKPESKQTTSKKRSKGGRKTPASDPKVSSPFDRETLDALISMAGENDVSVDWLIARAIQLYIREHKATGRL